MTFAQLQRKNFLLTAKLGGTRTALNSARKSRDSWKRRAELAEEKLLILKSELKK